ncbi:MAG TPA: HP1 family phage holin [Candidatus Acidoferrum sp.]|nr:HP1 family phage holin [Candidatus Acidoferrum sp.]
MEKNASVASYCAGAVTAFFGGVSLEHAALWVGILTSVGTFAVNAYFKYREAKRAEARDGQ